MKSFKRILPFFIFIIVLACGKEGDDSFSEPNNRTLPSLTTNTASAVTGFSATLGGNITAEGGTPVNYRGVCWSLNSNPTINDESFTADGSGLGNFSVTVENLLPNTTYNVRAFAGNQAGTAYGNNVQFRTTDLVNIIADIPRNINVSRVDMSATITNPNSLFISEKGFVFSTSPTPTVDDYKVEASGSGASYGGQITNLNINTTFYVRPYVRVSGDYIYGNENSFKTTGDFGPAGGYVIFDKGETTDGWRYLEAATTTSSFSAKWGCNSTFISGTFPEIGKGPNNTNLITSSCSDSDCAARKCANYTQSGYSDWFLPSTEEAIIAMRSLLDLNSLSSPYLWTSTQSSNSEAYDIYLNSSQNIITTTSPKYTSETIVPLRRY